MHQKESFEMQKKFEALQANLTKLNQIEAERKRLEDLLCESSNRNHLKCKKKFETLQANLTKLNQIEAERKRLEDLLCARQQSEQASRFEIEEAKKEQSQQQILSHNIQAATITITTITTTSITATTTMTKSMIKLLPQMIIPVSIIGMIGIIVLFGISSFSFASHQKSQSKNGTIVSMPTISIFLPFFTVSLLIILFVVVIFCCYVRKNRRDGVRKLIAREDVVRRRGGGGTEGLAKTCSAADAPLTTTTTTTTAAAAAAAAAMSTPTSDILQTKFSLSQNSAIRNDSPSDSKSLASSLNGLKADSSGGRSFSSKMSKNKNDREKKELKLLSGIRMETRPKSQPQPQPRSLQQALTNEMRNNSSLAWPFASLDRYRSGMISEFNSDQSTLSKTNVESGGRSGEQLDTSSKSKLFLAKKSKMPIYDNDDINSIKKAKSVIGKIHPQPITNPKVRTGGGASSLSFAQISNVTSALDSPDSKYRVSSTTPEPKIFSSKR